MDLTGTVCVSRTVFLEFRFSCLSSVQALCIVSHWHWPLTSFSFSIGFRIRHISAFIDVNHVLNEEIHTFILRHKILYSCTVSGLLCPLFNTHTHTHTHILFLCLVFILGLKSTALTTCSCLHQNTVSWSKHVDLLFLQWLDVGCLHVRRNGRVLDEEFNPLCTVTSWLKTWAEHAALKTEIRF